MLALERECGTLVMIEQRGLPFRCVVAVGAGRDLVGFRKLFTVHILVALLALGRGLLKVRIDQLSLEIRRFVAVDAGHCAMRPLQRKSRVIVIETL